MKKSKNSIGGGYFRVTAELARNNKLQWVVFLTFPGQSRYFLTNDDDKPRRYDGRDQALLAGLMAFPTVLSNYCEKHTNNDISGALAIKAAEEYFSVPKQNSPNFLVEHKVNKIGKSENEH